MSDKLKTMEYTGGKLIAHQAFRVLHAHRMMEYWEKNRDKQTSNVQCHADVWWGRFGEARESLCLLTGMDNLDVRELLDYYDYITHTGDE